MSGSESYFSTAVGLLRRTMPFLALNAMIHGAFALATIVWFAIWIGLVILVAKASTGMALLFLFIAMAVPGGILWWGQRWLLYMVKGAHIAVLTKALFQQPLPEGKSQIEFGRDLVKRQFVDLNMLFALDVLIHGVLRFVTGMIMAVASWLPGGLQQVARAITEIIQQSLTYVDEAILSYAVARNEPNVWNSARHGVILYAQSYKSILFTAVKIWLISKVFWLACLLVFGGPFLLIALAKGGVNSISDWILVGSAIFMASIAERALFEPFAMTYTLVTYHRTIAGQTPNAEWDAKLMQHSAKFRELTDKAKAFVAPAGAAALAQAAPAAMPAPAAPPSAAPPWAPPAAPPAGMPPAAVETWSAPQPIPNGPPAPAWAPPSAAPQAAPAWAPPSAAPQAAPAWAPPSAAPQAAPAWAPPSAAPQAAPAPLPTAGPVANPINVPPPAALPVPPAAAPAPAAPELAWGQPQPPAATPGAPPTATPDAGRSDGGRTIAGWNIGELQLPGQKPPGSNS